MITKHDLVRVALSDYLLNNKELIDKNIEYKNRSNSLRYDSFDLIAIESIGTNDGGKWVEGINFDEKDDPVEFEKLVKIEVSIPNRKQKEKIPELIALLRGASEEDKNALEKELMNLVSQDIAAEYTVKYTEKGLMIKDDPKFQVFVQKCINEIVNEINNK